MSIAYLKQRLNVSVERFSEPAQAQNKFARPHKLIKTLDIIERRFDDMENAQPIEEKIINSIKKLEKSGIDYLTKRDWKNLAWSLSKKLPHYEDKILFTFVGSKLINQFKNMQPALLKAVYFPLLYSYFAVEQEEINKRPNNWLELKNILSNNRSSLFQTTTRPKKWLTTLTDHPELLSADPSKKFIRNFLHNSDRDRVSNQLESLSIAPNSWFWDSLVSSSIKSVKTMKEDDYLEAIPRFLQLLEQNPIYTKDILTALLERYATTSRRTIVHEVLKNISLTQWGNPQFESSAGWRNVSLDTKKMVIQWFVRADLEAFFKLFSHTADRDRFDYWIKFIDKISFSQIFLGTAALQSRNPAHKKFIEFNRGRLKNLIGSTPSNNAFLLKIDNVHIVDFSDTGNACYGYSDLPFNLSKKNITVHELKSKQHSIFKSDSGRGMSLSHSGNWEARFDEKLAELGVFANQPASPKYKRRH
ncbi:EH signature domain-containing protein [uncultured Psychrobacter sp.]|uniref:EH signature domain-containing protein n=1 Tax=uncultured Psychrobacter sp. TaxID=259303 RepID=UPI002595C5FE|nr:EH signature domain-containing protein [uncultured Psychrobacter sp.]